LSREPCGARHRPGRRRGGCRVRVVAMRARSVRQVRGERPCRVNRVVRAIDWADAVAAVACARDCEVFAQCSSPRSCRAHARTRDRERRDSSARRPCSHASRSLGAWPRALRACSTSRRERARTHLVYRCDPVRGLHQGGRAGACPPPRCTPHRPATPVKRSRRQRGFIGCRERARRGTSPRPTSRTLRVPTGGSGWDPPCSLTRRMASSVAGLQRIATRARSIRQVRGERPCRVNRVVRAIDRADAVAVVACVSSRCERGASGRSEGRGLVA
jgi:hypothetical protein